MGFADSYLGRLRAAVGSVPLIAVGVRVLVEDERGRFLTIRRSDTGEWGLPGGAMEPGESLADTARREVFEETNARLRAITPFALSSDPARESYTYPNGDRVQFVSLFVHGFHDGGALRRNDGEALDLRFRAEGEIEREAFVQQEIVVFGQWRRFVRTGRFQVL